MWSKHFKSAAALLLAGAIAVSVPVISMGTAVSANAAAAASSSQNEWYYNVIDSSTIPDGEYVFYNANTQTLMTDKIEKSNNSFPSYKTNARFGYYTAASAVPSQYRYQIKSAGNGYYYILNSDGLYLDIVTYGKLQFTSTPSPLYFEIYSGDYDEVIIRKKVGDNEYAISMYSTEWFTVHNYSSGAAGQRLTLMKYEDKPTTISYKKISDYGIQNYDTDREFTPKRVGNIAAYSRNTLAMNRGFSNRIATGIWATPGEKLKVYVQAEESDPLPSIEFTQHISDSQEKVTIALKRGLNELNVPTLHSDFSSYQTSTEPGGTVYLLNPYTSSQQSANVKVYIEGGDKIPVFRQGDNVQEFIAGLKEYYNNYQQGKKGYHNITELVSQHTLFTLRLTRVYEGYVQNGLDPQATSLAWDRYMEKLFEFDGLEPSEYKNLVLPIKLNQPYGAAYASIGFLGIQDGDMSAAALTETKRGWAYSHEIGHILDIGARESTEVTNNMWAIQYAVENETRYDNAILKRRSEMIPLIQNETTNIYTSGADKSYFWTLSMFWDLEMYHDGYWAELDEMYRNGKSGNSTVDGYAKNMSREEKVAVYSSKIIGIDLTYYFKRYGYLTSPSAYYTNAITSMSLSKAQPKFWYYDDTVYTKPLSSNAGKTGTIEHSDEKGMNSVFFNISDTYKDAHLGFEIIRDGKVVDFIWGLRYTSDNISGDYVVNAYDRSLNVYKTLSFNVSLNPKQYVVHCGNTIYGSLQDAVNGAADGATIYIENSIAIKEQIVIDGKSLTIMPKDTSKKVAIYNDAASDIFVLKNGASLTLKGGSSKDDMLVLDGENKSSYSLFRLYSGSKVSVEKGVTVRNFKNSSAGSVVFAEGASTVDLKGCIIEYNKTSKGTVYLMGGSTLNSSNGTVIRQNHSDNAGSAIYLHTADDKAYLKDTNIYRNHATNQSTGSTIYVNAGYISIGNGTSIRENVSDWYNLNTAMYLSANAKAAFSGNVDIDDMVTVNGKVSINPQISGILNIRTDKSYTGDGNVLAVPTKDSFPKSILSTVNYHHSSFTLINNVDSLVIKEIVPLKNTSTISATSLTAGRDLAIKAAATGGTGSYTYAVYYKKSTESKWTAKQSFSENSVVVLTPTDNAVYNICVKVKDSAGTIEKKYFDVTVKKVALSVNASVSAESITLGSSITAKASATGGTGSYTYAFYYKQKSQSKWTVKQDFSTKTSVSIKPAKATDYDICIKAKDKSGTLVKKYFTVKVIAPLTLSVTGVPQTLKLGNSFTVKAAGAGGVTPYNYGFYYKKTTDQKWTTAKGFSTSNSASIKPAKAAEYEICIKVKDSNGTITKKYYYVDVTK